jgi:hypothetical protein
MFYLPLDVFNQRVNIPFGMRERAIPVLPMRERSKHRFFLNPERRARFDVLDEIRQIHGWMEARKDVQMIFGSVNAV